MTTAARNERHPQAIQAEAAARERLLEQFPDGGQYLDGFQALQPEHFAVIKVGGSIIEDNDLREKTAEDLVHLQELGLPTFVVYGGGNQIGAALKRHGRSTEFAENGTRITKPEDMPAVIEGLDFAGRALQREIVNRGGSALRIDNRLQAILPDLENLGSAKRAVLTTQRRVELEEKIRGGSINLISPVGLEAVRSRGPININADIAAAAIAKAMPVRKVILMTEEGGINGEDGERIRRLYADDADRLVKAGIISGGAVVKAMSALDAKSGAHDVVVTSPDELLTELFTEDGAGTIIRVRD